MTKNKMNILDNTPTTTQNTYKKGANGLSSLTPDGTIEMYKIDNLMTFYILELMEELRNKISKGKIRDPEKEKIRLKYYNTFLNAINTYNKIKKPDSFIKDDKMQEFYENLDLQEEAETVIMNFNQQQKEKTNS